MVEVQKPMVFCDFCGARATLCGNRRGNLLARPSAGIGVVEVQKLMVFGISKVPAQPSAGIGVVEVQKLEVFCDVQPARATLCGDRRGRGAKTHGFCDFCSARAGIGAVEVQKLEVFATFVVRTGLRELSRGSRACSRNRRVAGSIPPWSAGGRRKMQLAFYSNLHRASCTEQLAQTNLHRPVCAERLA